MNVNVSGKFNSGAITDVENLKKTILGTSLVVQWLGIHFPMKGMRFQTPVREQRYYILLGN